MSAGAVEIRFVGELRRCDVRPGDRFVMTTDQMITSETHKVLQDTWRAFIGGDETKLLVLMPGWKLGVFGDAEPMPEHVADLLAAAREVMDMLEEHGGSIVPHLLDTDMNAGQRLRDAIAAFEAQP